MRSALLFVLAALAVHSASAQLLMPDGKINAECGPTPRDPPLPVPAFVAPATADLPTQAVVRMAAGVPTPVELPAQIGGSGTKAIIDFNAKGVAIGWWLPKVGAVHLHLKAVTWSHLMANPGLAARLALLAILPNRDSATVAAIGSAYPNTLHILDMCDVWNPLVATLNATRPQPLPPPPPPSADVWKTKGGRIYTTFSGRLSQQTARTAPPGLTCVRGSLVVVVGTRTYLPIQGAVSQTEVAECGQVQP